jgi:hypothetical protein
VQKAETCMPMSYLCGLWIFVGQSCASELGADKAARSMMTMMVSDGTVFRTVMMVRVRMWVRMEMIVYNWMC